MLDFFFFSCAAKCTIENMWRCLIGQCTIEGTWRCLHWLLKAIYVINNHGEHCDTLFGLLKIEVANTYAFHGRPTLKDVERQLRNGSFRELNEMEMYSNVTEMEVKILLR